MHFFCVSYRQRHVSAAFCYFSGAFFGYLGAPYFAIAQYGLLAAIARWAIRRLPGVALRLPRAVFWRRQMSISPRHLWRGGGRQAGGEVKFSHAIYGEQGERSCRSSSIGLQLCRDLLCSILIFCTCVSLCCPKIAPIEAQVVVVSTIRITLV